MYVDRVPVQQQQYWADGAEGADGASRGIEILSMSAALIDTIISAGSNFWTLLSHFWRLKAEDLIFALMRGSDRSES